MVRPSPLSRLLLIGSLLLVAGAARAEDFTGFYAGVSAGYGVGHEETRGTARSPVSPASSSGTGTSGDGLPPSASAAAAALRRSGAGRAADGR